MLGALAAHATPVVVPNASFESPVSPTQTSTNTTILTGWVFNVKGGSAYGSESISSNFLTAGASTGSNAAFINNDWPDVTDTITSATSLGTIAPLTTYTFTLALGNRKTSDTSLYGSPGNISFSLLANGVAFATKTVNNGTVPNGTFQDFTLTYTTTASSPIIGETLKLQLATLPEEGSAYQPAFDNVTLDATALPVAVPEPATWALVISGALALGWMTRWRRIARTFQPDRGPTLVLILVLTLLGGSLLKAEAIKTLPLDDQTVYHLKIGTDKVTTLVFRSLLRHWKAAGSPPIRSLPPRYCSATMRATASFRCVPWPSLPMRH